MNRRSFLATAGLAAAPGFALSQDARGKLKIRALEFWRLEGRYDTMAGANRQHQVQPLHVYDEHRPAPYRESGGKASSAPAGALYLKILTDAGVEGVYGPIDREAAVVVDLQLRPFLVGKDPLAGDALWDKMYRLNRHARGGHFMMAISAVDNALWDLRGRYFNAPVYRLLGGPSRDAVEAYGSCLGYSVEPEAVRRKCAELYREGFRCQKWFMAYGPGDGAAGLAKSVELVASFARRWATTPRSCSTPSWDGSSTSPSPGPGRRSVTVPDGSRRRSEWTSWRPSSSCAGRRPCRSPPASTSTGAGR